MGLEPAWDWVLSETGIGGVSAVQYWRSVNQRATSWLLATLLAVCAAQAVPSVRFERQTANCAIVSVARARSERLVVIRTAVRHGRAPVPTALPDSPEASSALYSKSLYQRPPPCILF